MIKQHHQGLLIHSENHAQYDEKQAQDETWQINIHLQAQTLYQQDKDSPVNKIVGSLLLLMVDVEKYGCGSKTKYIFE